MSDLMIQSAQSTAVPLPSVNVTIRAGAMSDVPFLDSLQKLHTKQVGWMPTAQFEGKIKLGHVLIAESDGEPVGYCLGSDQYFKRDDVGIIYQMNVMPGKQRGFIGATLLKVMFDRAAYGCKLFCCWCAQDIAANKFWEAMGFVPLAFRAGSEKKSRIHIFWQKRIRSGDTTTPWWFPSKTAGGSIREDRIVLPIPPGTHWSDAKPLILPGGDDESKRLPEPKRAAVKKTKVIEKPRAVKRNGLSFDIPKQGEPVAIEKPRREPKQKPKNDPRLVAAARELRDRWLEQVNDPGAPGLLLSQGKYDVSKELLSPVPKEILQLPQPIAA